MVDVAQLVRVPDCGSEGRGFEPLLPPTHKRLLFSGQSFFVCTYIIFKACKGAKPKTDS